MKTRLPLLAFALGLLLAARPAAAGNNCDDPRPLRLALTPIKNAEIQATQYRPLIQQLEKQLARRVELVPAPSYGTVIEGLLADGVDLAELGPASYAIARSRGARITPFASFALRKPGSEPASSYRSLLIVRRDRGLDTIESLRGSTVSLTDPASTSGTILPRQAISRLTGQSLETYFQRLSFAGSHDRAIEAVQKKRVDAAFVASSRLDEALRQGTVQTDELKVIWQSLPIPYDPFVLRDRLCPALAAGIKQVFLGDSRALHGMFSELNMKGFIAVGDGQYREIRELFANPN